MIHDLATLYFHYILLPWWKNDKNYMTNNNTILPISSKWLHRNQGANKHIYSCREVQSFFWPFNLVYTIYIILLKISFSFVSAELKFGSPKDQCVILLLATGKSFHSLGSVLCIHVLPWIDLALRLLEFKSSALPQLCRESRQGVRHQKIICQVRKCFLLS